LVDVVVRGKHNEFIRDLKPGAFTVLENGKPQKIAAFSEHSSSQASPPQQMQLPPNVYANFTALDPGHPITIVLLDMLNTDYLERTYARQQMLKFLSSLPGKQPIALFVLGSKLRMLQGFTQSSDALVTAAKRLLDKDENAHLQTSDQEMGDAEAMDEMMATVVGLAPTNAVSIAGALANEQVAQTNIRVLSTLRCLQAMATMVAGYTGRKNLIWLSSDFPIEFGPQFALAFTPRGAQSVAQDDRRSQLKNEASLFTDELRRTASQLASSQMALYPISVRGLTTDVDTAASMRITGTSQSEGQQRTFARWGVQDTMEDIARETGGDAFFNQNDLRSLMQRSLDEGTNYYTLAYSPQDHNWNSSYRKIEVRVAAEGVKLGYREGYFAVPEQTADQKTAAQLLAAAMQPSVPESTSLLFKAQVLPPANGRKTISIDFAVSPSALAFTAGSDQRQNATLDFMAVALDRNQKESGVASNTIAATMRPETYQEVLKTGFPGHLDLELKPGRYLLRLGVIDHNNQKIGTLDVPLQIPGGTAKK
jgi:VWFA-related protein